MLFMAGKSIIQTIQMVLVARGARDLPSAWIYIPQKRKKGRRLQFISVHLTLPIKIYLQVCIYCIIHIYIYLANAWLQCQRKRSSSSFLVCKLLRGWCDAVSIPFQHFVSLEILGKFICYYRMRTPINGFGCWISLRLILFEYSFYDERKLGVNSFGILLIIIKLTVDFDKFLSWTLWFCWVMTMKFNVRNRTYDDMHNTCYV